MPERKTIQRANQKKAGEFVREEMEHIRKGKHGARSSKQAIAIGLSKARKAGVLKREPRRAASHRALATQARKSARERGPQARFLAAAKAIRAKGLSFLRQAARKATRTRKAA
jgi:hypothetical protein